MFEARLSFLEFALEKVTKEMEDVLVGMEERKKGEQDVEGVRTGKNLFKPVLLLESEFTFTLLFSWTISQPILLFVFIYFPKNICK